jgi:hypothetical protein
LLLFLTLARFFEEAENKEKAVKSSLKWCISGENGLLLPNVDKGQSIFAFS